MDFPRGIRSHGAGLQIRFQYKGQQYTETIETRTPYNVRTIAAAVRRYEEIRSRLKLGLPVQVSAGGHALLVSEVAQQYLDGLDVERSTILSYMQMLNKHWLPLFGHWKLTDVRPSHIKAYLATTTLSSKTKLCILGPLRGVFNYAIDDGTIDTNPVTAIKVKKHQKPPITRFTLEERERIMSKLSGQDAVYFTTMFETGMRPSEILALQWSDYNGTHIHVNKAMVWGRLKLTTKNHEVRDVYVSDHLREALQGLPTRFQGREIFLDPDGEGIKYVKRFNNVWREALKRARVSHRISYTCRHTRAAMMLTGGIDVMYAANQLGHTKEVFLRTYSTWINELGDKAQEDKLEALSSLKGTVRVSKP
jgi:integrase